MHGPAGMARCRTQPRPSRSGLVPIAKAHAAPRHPLRRRRHFAAHRDFELLLIQPGIALAIVESARKDAVTRHEWIL